MCAHAHDVYTSAGSIEFEFEYARVYEFDRVHVQVASAHVQMSRAQ